MGDKRKRHPPAEVGPTIDRRSYLGASDIGAVAGLNPYRTALDVWAEKTGIHTAVADDGRAERMRVGHELERPVIERLYAPPRRLALVYPGTIRHESEPWAAATPDGVSYPDHRADLAEWLAAVGGRRGPPAPLAPLVQPVEVKIVGTRQAWRWDADAASGGVPPEVYAQVQWQLAVLGAAFVTADVPALLGTELRVYRVPRDDAAIADLMEIGRAFWRQAVEGGAMPEPDGSDRAAGVIAARYRAATGAMLEATAELAALAREYDAARARAEEADNRKGELASRLRAAIGTADGFAGDGVRATWRPEAGKPRWREVALAAGATPALIAEHRGDAVRVLRVTVKEE